MRFALVIMKMKKKHHDMLVKSVVGQHITLVNGEDAVVKLSYEAV